MPVLESRPNMLNFDLPYRQFVPQPQAQPKPDLIGLLAQSTGQGIGQGVQTGIGNAMEKAALQKAIGMIPQGGGLLDKLNALAGAEPQAREWLMQNYLPAAQKQQEEQAYLRSLAGSMGYNVGEPAPQQAPQQPQPGMMQQAQPGIQQPAQQNAPAEPREENPALLQKQQEDIQHIRGMAGLNAEQRKEFQKERREDQRAAQKFNEPFKEQMNRSYDTYRQHRNVLNQMRDLNDKEDLSNPKLISLLDKLGLPIGWINNPSAEEFDKLTQQLMNGIQDTYGSRILQQEVQNYMKSIPSLMNTKEGRERVIRDLININEAKKTKFQTYLDLSDGGKYLPLNLQEMVNEVSGRRLDKQANQLVESAQYFQPLTMTKNGKSYAVPAAFINKALMKGYQLSQPGATAEPVGQQVPQKKPLGSYAR